MLHAARAGTRSWSFNDCCLRPQALNWKAKPGRICEALGIWHMLVGSCLYVGTCNICLFLLVVSWFSSLACFLVCSLSCFLARLLAFAVVLCLVCLLAFFACVPFLLLLLSLSETVSRTFQTVRLLVIIPCVCCLCCF